MVYSCWGGITPYQSVCSLLFFDCYVVLFQLYVCGYEPPLSCANAGCSGNHPTRAHVRAMMYLIFLVFMYVRVVRTTFSHHLFFLLHVSSSLNESLDKLDIQEYTSTIAFLIVTDDKLTSYASNFLNSDITKRSTAHSEPYNYCTVQNFITSHVLFFKNS